MENKQNNQWIILIALTLFLVITEGCRSNTAQLEAKKTPVQVVNYATAPTVSSIAPSLTNTIATVALPSPPTSTPAPLTPTTGATTVPLAPTSTLPSRVDPQSSQSTLPEPPNLHEFIPMECMEEESKDFSISTDDPTPTYFVDGRWVIIPLRICRNSDDYRSDHNWLFSIQVNSVTSVDGRSLDNLPKMYLRYRKHPNDDNLYIRENEDAIYFFRYDARTKQYYTLVRARGIYDLVFEFEGTDELNSIPRTIDLHIKVDLFWV